MKIKVKKYEGPWPKEARFLEPGEEVLLATGAIGAGPFTGVVEGLEKVALGSLLGTMGTLVTIPVDGDSMSGAGILDGDIAVLDIDVSRVQNGDCVAVKYDGGFSLKYIRQDEEATWLIPDNPNLKPMKFVAPEMPEVCGICVAAFSRRPRLSKDRFVRIRSSAPGVDVFGREENSGTSLRAVECGKEMQRRMAFRKSLVELFNRKGSNGKLLFTKKVQWVAIFRVAIERGFAFEQDYAGFENYLKFIELTELPVPFDKDILRKTDYGVYHLPISEWTADRYIEKNMAKTAKPFFSINDVANTFLEILDRNLN